MPVEHIIFDCDGVLVDSEWLACEVDADLINQYGGDATPEFIRDNYVGIDIVTMQTAIERDFGIALPNDFQQQALDAIVSAFEKGLSAIPHVGTVLAALPHCRSVASNSSSERVHTSLHVTGLDRHFAGNVFTADQVTRPKPAPDLFELILERMSLQGEQCLLIEDSASGAIAAGKLGIPVFGFLGGSHCTSATRAKLERAGVTTFFDDMRKLPELINRL